MGTSLGRNQSDVKTEKQRAKSRRLFAALNWFFVLIVGFVLASPFLARAAVTSLGLHPTPWHEMLPRIVPMLLALGVYQAAKAWRRRRRP